MDRPTQIAEDYFASRRNQGMRPGVELPISFRPETFESKIGLFVASTIEKVSLDNKWIRRYSEIVATRVIGIVTLNSKGVVDLNAAAQPDADCWYFLDCIGPAGAVFSIISDTYCWYPINRRSLKISRNRKPKSSVDLERMSITDQELIKEAVEEYIGILLG